MPAWMKLTAWDRGEVPEEDRRPDALNGCRMRIARIMTMEQGKPLREARWEVIHSADTFEWFAEEGKRAYGQVIPQTVAAKRHMTIKHPVGVVGAISPWNFPITLLCRKIAPALAAGCTIVAKPSELTPLSGIALFELLEAAGVPKGVANLVTGPGEEVAAEFMANKAVRKVSFTGSTRVGKILMRQAADQVKRISLELGGHAPFIVFPDADPEVVAKAAVVGKFRNNGQVCISSQPLLRT